MDTTKTAAQQRLKFSKLLGKDNPADLYTKHLDTRTINNHLKKMEYCEASGRATEAPKLHVLSRSMAEYYNGNANGEGSVCKWVNMTMRAMMTSESGGSAKNGQIQNVYRNGKRIHVYDKERIDVYDNGRIDVYESTSSDQRMLRGYNWPIQGSNGSNAAQLSQPRGSTRTSQSTAMRETDVSWVHGLRHGVTMHPRGRHLREGMILLVHGGITIRDTNEHTTTTTTKDCVNDHDSQEAGSGRQDGSRKARTRKEAAKVSGETGYEPKQYQSIPNAKGQSGELYRRCQVWGRQMQNLIGFPEDTEQHGVADKKESPPSDERKIHGSIEAGDRCHPAGPSRPRVGK